MVIQKSESRYALDAGVILKRILDVAVAICALILLSPLFCMIAVLIYIDDRGPIIFTQSRVGRYNVPFRMLKFRTMSVDAEQIQAQHHSLIIRDEFVVKRKNDPRITRVGKWLRRWSLDELPQLLNVARGEMSLIGPRPFVMTEIDNCTRGQLRRLDILPGITGWAQVHGRSNLSFDEIIRYDIWYVQHQSLLLDLKIVYATCRVVINCNGAY